MNLYYKERCLSVCLSVCHVCLYEHFFDFSSPPKKVTSPCQNITASMLMDFTHSGEGHRTICREIWLQDSKKVSKNVCTDRLYPSDSLSVRTNPKGEQNGRRSQPICELR